MIHELHRNMQDLGKARRKWSHVQVEVFHAKKKQMFLVELWVLLLR